MRLYGSMAAGAFVGTLLRTGTGCLLSAWGDSSETLGLSLLSVWLVNVLGCYGLGWFLAMSETHRRWGRWRIPVASGFFGSLTTFSSVSLGVLELLHEGKPIFALLYLHGILVSGLVAYGCGRYFRVLR
jgi:CrcB protein